LLQKIFYFNFNNYSQSLRSKEAESSQIEWFNGDSKTISLFSNVFDSVQEFVPKDWSCFVQGLHQFSVANFNFNPSEDAIREIFDFLLKEFWNDYSLTYFHYQKVELNFVSCELFSIGSLISSDNFFDNLLENRDLVNSKFFNNFKITKFENKSLMLIHCDSKSQSLNVWG
jgi:hypothetical protein